MSLPSPSSLPTLPSSSLTQILDTLLEPTPSLHPLFLHLVRSAPPPASYNSLIATLETELLHLCEILNQSDSVGGIEDTDTLPSADGKFLTSPADVKEIIHDVLNSHPRLGAPKPAAAGSQNVTLSALSAAEQKAMNSASSSAATTTDTSTPADLSSETAQLAQLNAEYEAAYPGMRFVTFVAGRPRSVIMQEMREAIKRSGEKGAMAEEKRKAVKAVCRIAEARVEALGIEGQ